MSDLSDFKRLVYEPETKALRERCARLQQALETIERDFPGDDDNWRWVTTLCREALAGQGTPADSQEDKT